MVSKSESLDLVISNQAFHCLLLNSVPVEYKRNDRVIRDHVVLVDFNDLPANRFRAINQFTIEGSKQLHRLDIVYFINGLPLTVLELKSLGAENVNIQNASDHIQTYKDETADLISLSTIPTFH